MGATRNIFKPTGIQIATKSFVRFNHPTCRTSETYRRQDDVFGYKLQFLLYKLQFLLSGVLPVVRNLNYKLLRKDCLSIHTKSSSKVIQKVFQAVGGLDEVKLRDT